MSLSFSAKHLDNSTLPTCGAHAFGGYRICLAREVDPLFGFLYQGFYGASWKKDENGEQYADTFVDIDDYVREGVVIEDPQQYKRHPSRRPPEIDCLARRIRAWLAPTGAVSDVDVRFENWADGYCVSFRLSWPRWCDWLDENLDPALDNLFFASDCEGRWTWQECRDIYKSLEHIDFSFPYNHKYSHEEDLHDRLMRSWRACWKNRVQMTWI